MDDTILFAIVTVSTTREQKPFKQGFFTAQKYLKAPRSVNIVSVFKTYLD